MIRDDAPGAGIFDQVPQFAFLIHGVHQHGDGSQFPESQERNHVLRDVLQLDADAVSVANPPGLQGGSERIRELVQFRSGEQTVKVCDCLAARVGMYAGLPGLHQGTRPDLEVRCQPGWISRSPSRCERSVLHCMPASLYWLRSDVMVRLLPCDRSLGRSSVKNVTRQCQPPLDT